MKSRSISSTYEPFLHRRWKSLRSEGWNGSCNRTVCSLKGEEQTNMMKKISTLVIGALGVTAFASACSVETSTPELEQIGSNSEAVVCSNEQAVNIVLAGLATSAAMEMKRWLPERDFTFANGVLSISSYGVGRCPKYDGVNKECRYTQRWLNTQNWASNGEIIEGQALDVGVLRSRIATQWQRQMDCNNRPDNGAADNCPVEYHDLVFTSKVKGACADDYWFHAYYMSTSNNLSGIDAAQLKNKLIWAGYPENPYLAFGSTYAGDVKVDPGGNTQGGGGTTVSSGIYPVNPNTTAAPYCSNSVMEGALSDGGIPAALGGQCQCMTAPAQAVYTFKPALIAGFLKCKP